MAYQQYTKKVFWPRVRLALSDEDILLALEDACQFNPSGKRRGHNGLKNVRRKWIRKYRHKYPLGKCLVCRGEGQVHHHIVMLVNRGGNHRSNITTLCHECHLSIHPWLVDS